MPQPSIDYASVRDNLGQASQDPSKVPHWVQAAQLLRSRLRPRLWLLESLLRSGLRRSRLWSRLLSGLRLLDGILLRLLLILDNLSLELLFPVDSLLDLIKETLGLGAAGVKCVGSWLWLLLWRLSRLHLWLLLLRHKL